MTDLATPPRASLRAALVWVLSGRVVGALMFGFDNALLARLLGTSDFGYFVVVSNGATFAGFIAAAGLNRTLLRDIPAHRARQDPVGLARRLDLSRDILRIALPATSLLASIVVLGLLRSWGAEELTLALLTGLLTIANAVQALLSDLLRGFGEIRWASFLEGRSGGALVMTIQGVLLVPFVGGALSLNEALALNLAAYALAVPGACRLLRLFWQQARAEAPVRIEPLDLDDAWRKAFLRTSGVFVASQVVAFLATQIDLWIAAAILSPEDVSLYAAAQRILMIVVMPLAAMHFALMPAIAAHYARDEMSELEHTLRRSATLGAVPAVPMFVAIFLAPAFILGALFGSAYEAGSTVLVILAIGQVVNVWSGMSAAALIMGHEETLVLGINVVSAVFRTAAGIPAAMRWGPEGLAWVSTIATAAMFLAQWLAAKQRLGVWSHPTRHVNIRELLGARTS